MDSWDYYSTSERPRTIAKVRSTFMVEALLLLACVIILLAVTIALFAFASATSTKAQRMQESADIAQNVAEQFAANPAEMPEVQSAGDYTVRCDISEEETESGSLYNARVIVMHEADEMCSLDVSKYVPGQRALSATPSVEANPQDAQAAGAEGAAPEGAQG